MSPVVTQLIASRPSGAGFASLFSEGDEVEHVAATKPARRSARAGLWQGATMRIREALMIRVPRADLAPCHAWR